jgi:hypothetical protein
MPSPSAGPAGRFGERPDHPPFWTVSCVLVGRPVTSARVNTGNGIARAQSCLLASADLKRLEIRVTGRD